ncbi:MAG TPA: hypothetical protein VEC35_19315 [Noviherbaspirillum sp.]|nr:hypothetical protein [Noviherbaspirillum sp.]
MISTNATNTAGNNVYRPNQIENDMKSAITAWAKDRKNINDLLTPDFTDQLKYLETGSQRSVCGLLFEHAGGNVNIDNPVVQTMRKWAFKHAPQLVDFIDNTFPRDESKRTEKINQLLSKSLDQTESFDIERLNHLRVTKKDVIFMLEKLVELHMHDCSLAQACKQWLRTVFASWEDFSGSVQIALNTMNTQYINAFLGERWKEDYRDNQLPTIIKNYIAGMPGLMLIYNEWEKDNKRLNHMEQSIDCLSLNQSLNHSMTRGPRQSANNIANALEEKIYSPSLDTNKGNSEKISDVSRLSFPTRSAVMGKTATRETNQGETDIKKSRVMEQSVIPSLFDTNKGNSEKIPNVSHLLSPKRNEIEENIPVSEMNLQKSNLKSDEISLEEISLKSFERTTLKEIDANPIPRISVDKKKLQENACRVHQILDQMYTLTPQISKKEGWTEIQKFLMNNPIDPNTTRGPDTRSVLQRILQCLKNEGACEALEALFPYITDSFVVFGGAYSPMHIVTPSFPLSFREAMPSNHEKLFPNLLQRLEEAYKRNTQQQKSSGAVQPLRSDQVMKHSDVSNMPFSNDCAEDFLRKFAELCGWKDYRLDYGNRSIVNKNQLNLGAFVTALNSEMGRQPITIKNTHSTSNIYSQNKNIDAAPF